MKRHKHYIKPEIELFECNVQRAIAASATLLQEEIIDVTISDFENWDGDLN